jgi:serine/threonine-protein kinase HipA
MARTLDVYLHRNLVGHLIQDDGGEMLFHYSETWVDDPAAIPLSQSLPLRKERYTRKECRGFFAGILPEADKREIIAKNLGISARNDFAMLEEIGGECAGAITFLPTGTIFPDQNERYRLLTNRELADILKILPRRPLMAGEDDVRLSLAGAQGKIAVFKENDQVSLPLGGAPSTHILKPAIDRFEGIVYNEWVCMQLAHEIGLPTAGTEVGAVEGIDYLLVKRYDRARAGSNSLRRLHQEDFCQALGIIPEHKYQREGGPTLQQCFSLVRDITAVPIKDLQSLLDGVIFNFIIGNNDAHGKNFSLLYEGEMGPETTLAPFYDLLSTMYYSELSPKMAMKIGGEYVAAEISARHFERFATEIGFSRPMVKRRIIALAALISSKLPEVTPNHSVAIGVAELIGNRCHHVAQLFTE